MYRVVKFGRGKYFAVELNLSQDMHKIEELDEMVQLANEGTEVIITDDYESYGAELIDRDSEHGRTKIIIRGILRDMFNTH